MPSSSIARHFIAPLFEGRLDEMREQDLLPLIDPRRRENFVRNERVKLIASPLNYLSAVLVVDDKFFPAALASEPLTGMVDELRQ
jgi:hypothetical protein